MVALTRHFVFSMQKATSSATIGPVRRILVTATGAEPTRITLPASSCCRSTLPTASARESGDFRHETQAPGLAPEFAVGDHLEAEAFLPMDHVHDAFVLDCLTGSLVRPKVQKPGRSQKTADVLGAVRRAAHG